MSYSTTQTKNKGFTLVEMAIVLVIIGIVLSAMITVLPSIIASAKARKTKAILEKIDYSVRGYIGATHHLPCPDTNNNGWENRNDHSLIGDPSDDTCTSEVGQLPFLTLGMADGNDAWNNVPKFGVYRELIQTTADTGGNPLCTVLSTLINTPVLPLTSRLYSHSPGGTDTNEAYIIVSGGPKNLDGNGDGFFDGLNEGSDLRFDHPNRPPDHTTANQQYDDLILVGSLNYLYGANCNGSGGGGGGGSNTGLETNCTNGIDDDSDGYTDCADQDCRADPACAANTAVQINTSALAATIIANHYTHTFQATGGSGEFDWSLVSSEILGLTINRLTGVISGDIAVCNQATPYNITVKVEDRADAGNVDTHTFGLTVNTGALTLSPTYETGDNPGTETMVCDNSAWIRTITANGPSVGEFNWSLAWGAPPPTGFAISKASATEGHLQKTGVVGTAQNYIATITATDDQCPNNTAPLNLTVQVTAGGTGAPYSAGLTGEYRFDECSLNNTAGDVTDSSGSGNDGTSEVGTVTIGSGHQCRAGVFTSGNDRISLPSTVLDGASDFTVAAWLKSADLTNKALVSGANDSDSNEFLVLFSSGTQLALFLHNSSRTVTIPTLNDNKWHHLVWTRAGTAETIYIDGTAAGLITRTSAPLSIATNGLWLAAEQDSVGGGWDSNQEFIGLLDEVMFWGKSLDPGEVQTIYSLDRGICTGTCYTDPVAEYSMEHFPWNGTAAEVKDTSGSTEENGVAAGGGSGTIPTQTSTSGGKVCRAGLFTKTDNSNGGYLDLADPALLDPGSSPWSITAWFNWDGASSENIICNKEGRYEIRVSGGYLQYAWQPHWAWDGGANFAVSANTWYHVAVVYDGRQQLLYRDGQLVYARTQSGAMGSTGNKFLIGARGSSSPHNFFGGKIDELRIYNRALAVNEVLGVYNSVATCPDNYPIITTTSLLSGIVGTAYSDTPAATGGDLPYGWDMVSSSVSGLSISNHSTGEIIGTIGSCAENYNVEVKLTDSNNVTDSKLLPITVNNGILTIAPATASLNCQADNSVTCQQDFTASGPLVGNLSNWTLNWQSTNPGGFVLTGSGTVVTVQQTGASTPGSGYRFRLTAQDASCPTNALTTDWSTIDIQ